MVKNCWHLNSGEKGGPRIWGEIRGRGLRGTAGKTL